MGVKLCGFRDLAYRKDGGFGHAFIMGLDSGEQCFGGLEAQLTGSGSGHARIGGFDSGGQHLGV